MPAQTQCNVTPRLYVLETRSNGDSEDRWIACVGFTIRVVVHQPYCSAADIVRASLGGVRCIREDGGEGTDGFKAQDAAGLDSGFVNGGDGEASGGWIGVGEEVLGRWEVEGGGCGDEGEEGRGFEKHFEERIDSIYD
jgi:hypothetical protein